MSQQAQQAQNRLHGIAGSPSYCPFHAGSLPPSPLGPSPRRPPRHPQPHLSLKTGSADAELVRTCAAVCHKEGGTRRRFVDSNGRGDVINTEAVMCWRRLAASREHGAAGARTRAPPPMAMLMLMAAGQTPLWGEARHCQTTDLVVEEAQGGHRQQAERSDVGAQDGHNGACISKKRGRADKDNASSPNRGGGGGGGGGGGWRAPPRPLSSPDACRLPPTLHAYSPALPSSLATLAPVM